MPSKLCFKRTSNGVFKLFSPKCIMMSTPSEPSLFAILPAELCIFIFTLAAKFSQFDKATNPYSTAVALCHVSRTVRYIVLPELLHTIVLPSGKNVLAFIRALKMQRTHGRKGNSLHFDYASRVYKIWIGEMTVAEHKRIDVSLLAPLLFAAKSLALDVGNVPLLDRCLTQVRKPTRFKFTKCRKSSSQLSPSWSTTILTLAGDLRSYQPMTWYGNDTQALRSTFFASIKQFIFLPPTLFRLNKYVPPGSTGPDESFLYCYDSVSPFSVDNFPWTSLKSPQTTVVALLAVSLRSSDFKSHVSGITQLGVRDVYVRLSEGAPTPSFRYNGQVSAGQKNRYLTSFYIDASLSFDGIVTARFDWGETWARGLSL